MTPQAKAHLRNAEISTNTLHAQELPYECLPEVPDAKVHPFLWGELTGSVLVLPFFMKTGHALQHVQVIQPQAPSQVEGIILPASRIALQGSG